MKFTSISALTLLSTGSVLAQGIYDLTPYDTELESIPLEWNAKVGFGWDDNVTPTTVGNRDDESSFFSFGLSSLYAERSPQTSIDFSASFGVQHYIDDIEAGDAEDTYYNGRLNFNVTRQVSETVRLATRNYLFYGLEPDFNFGAVNDRTNDEYLFFSTENAIGYEWTPRLGSYTGVRYTTLNYTSADSRNDRDSISLFHQQRYIFSQQTTGTLNYNLRFTDVEGGLDSDNHFITIGAEHRLSPTAVIVGNVGVQVRDVDTRDTETSPTFNLSYINRVNGQFKIRGNASYEINDFGTSFSDTARFDDNEVFRVALFVDYNLSPDVYLTGGVNYIDETFTGDDISDDDVQLVNLSLGATYQIYEYLKANITYNFTDSNDSGDTLARDYQRNRIQASLNYTF